MMSLVLTSMENLKKYLWALYLLLVSLSFVFAYLYTIPAEDAVILFEYAKNLANSGMIVYGGSDFPTEGATDFLWMILIALFKYIGFNEFGSSLFINLLSLGFIFYFFKDYSQKLVLGIAVLATPYLYASLTGFSALFFSAIYLLSLHLLFQRSKYLYVSILLLCLIRPDGVVWGAGLVFLRWLQLTDRVNFYQEIKLLLISLVIPGLLYFYARYVYFGELLPLPFLVKSSSIRDFFIFYSDSIRYVFVVVTPIVVSLVFVGRKKLDVMDFVIIFTLPIVFYSAMKLEQNIGNRFMAPLFFGGAYILARKFGLRALLLMLPLAIGLQLVTKPGDVSSTKVALSNVLNSNRETVYYVAQDLSALEGKMLVTEAGRLTYYSGWFSDDAWGLNTPRFAHNLITKDAVAEGNYDLIAAHCNLDLLSSEVTLEHDGSRSWNNQCKSLVAHIKEGDYEVLLLPYYNNNLTIKQRIGQILDVDFIGDGNLSGCKRYDIYAISRTYKYNKELNELLHNRGALIFEQANQFRVDGDMLCGVSAAF